MHMTRVQLPVCLVHIVALDFVRPRDRLPLAVLSG